MATGPLSKSENLSVAFLERVAKQRLTEEDKEILRAAALDEEPNKLSCEEVEGLKLRWEQFADNKQTAISVYLKRRAVDLLFQKKPHPLNDDVFCPFLERQFAYDLTEEAHSAMIEGAFTCATTKVCLDKACYPEEAIDAISVNRLIERLKEKEAPDFQSKKVQLIVNLVRKFHNEKLLDGLMEYYAQESEASRADRLAMVRLFGEELEKNWRPAMTATLAKILDPRLEPDSQLRATVVFALGNMGSSDKLVLDGVRVMLGRHYALEASPSLLVRREYVRALKKLGEQSPHLDVVKELVVFTDPAKEPNPFIRAEAVIALARLAYRKALPGVLTTVFEGTKKEREPDSLVRFFAAWMLLDMEKIMGSAKDSVAWRDGLNPFLKPNASDRIISIDRLEANKAKDFAPETVLALFETLYSDWEEDILVRRAAVRSLAYLGTQILEPVIPETLFKITSDPNSSAELTENANLGLIRLGELTASNPEKRAFDVREAHVAGINYEDAIRGKAVWSFGVTTHGGDKEINKQLLSQIKNKKKFSPFFRGEAILALARMGREDDVGEFFDFLEKEFNPMREPNDGVREKILKGLSFFSGGIYHQRVVAALAKRLNPYEEPSDWIRKEAIEALDRLGEKAATAVVRKGLENLANGHEALQLDYAIVLAATEALSAIFPVEDKTCPSSN